MIFVWCFEMLPNDVAFTSQNLKPFNHLPCCLHRISFSSISIYCLSSALNSCHRVPHFLQNSQIELSLFFLLSEGDMRDALEFRASGKGGFAFHKDFKIPLGTEGVLRRDPTNSYGKLITKDTILLRQGNTDITFHHLLDPDCIAMHLPKGFPSDAVVGFLPDGHFGNIGREYSSILAPLMDLGFGSLDDAASVSCYRTDFIFVVVLCYEKFSHRRAGYSVKIVLRTNLSDAWVSKIFTFLSEALKTSGNFPTLL